MCEFGKAIHKSKRASSISLFVRVVLGAGFYCDQRESREAVRKLSNGKSVLDM